MRGRVWLGLLVVVAAVQRAGAAGPTDEELAVIVNPQAGVGRIGAGELEAIFTASEHRWPGGAEIVAFNLPPESPTRVIFDRAVLHLSPDEVGRYWVDQRIRGGPRPPRQVPDPTLTVRVVARLPGAIGYVPRSLAEGAQVLVVARIRAGKVVDP